MYRLATKCTEKNRIEHNANTSNVAQTTQNVYSYGAPYAL